MPARCVSLLAALFGRALALLSVTAALIGALAFWSARDQSGRAYDDELRTAADVLYALMADELAERAAPADPKQSARVRELRSAEDRAAHQLRTKPPKSRVNVVADGSRDAPMTRSTTSSSRSRSTCANRRPPVSTVANSDSTIVTTGIWFGEVRPSGSARTKSSRSPCRSAQRNANSNPPPPLTGLPLKRMPSAAAGPVALSFACIVLSFVVSRGQSS